MSNKSNAYSGCGEYNVDGAVNQIPSKLCTSCSGDIDKEGCKVTTDLSHTLINAKHVYMSDYVEKLDKASIYPPHPLPKPIQQQILLLLNINEHSHIILIRI